MNRIRQLREERGWKQDELGDLLNVKRAAVSKYENENIPLTAETIKGLCNIFNVTADYLLGISDVRNSRERGLSEKEERVLELTGKLTDEDINKLMEYGELLRKANR